MTTKLKQELKKDILKEKGSYHYVLMADIIKSSEKIDIDKYKLFRKKIDKLNTEFKLISPFTITLGDEFQGIVESLEQGISIIFTLERLLIEDEYPFQLRYALGYGHIMTPINSEIAHGMYGEALTETRKLLEKSKKDRRRRFDVLLPNKRFEFILNNLFEVYQSFLDHWNKKDYEVIKQFYEHDDYKEVALALGKRKDQIWKREKNLRIREFFSQQESIKELAMFYDALQEKEIEFNDKFASDITELIIAKAKNEASKKNSKELPIQNIILEYIDSVNVMSLILNNLRSLLNFYK